MAAELKVLGAAQTVTGSKFLISLEGFSLLIDCGLYQGRERKRSEEVKSLNFPAHKIDALCLTHAHLDHCGYIPKLVKDGFKGPIFSTSATRDIARIILMDAAKIQLDEVREAKKKNLSKHQIGEPLYYDHDVKNAMNSFRPLELRDPLKIGPFEVEFHQAGHIPGAVSVGIKWKEGSVLFSGDLGRYNDLMTFDPKVTGSFDNIVMESTYGAKKHSDESQFEILKNVIQKAKHKTGTLLVPAFSLSRTQLLLLQIKEVFNSYPELELPVYINSPMANEVTETMIVHNETVKQDISDFTDAFKGFHFVREPWEAKSLYENSKPKIIVTASGMLSGGRVLTHLTQLAGCEQNTLFIPGFQAPGTLGEEIISGLREFEINETEVNLKAEVIHSQAFSAHADGEELVHWLEQLESSPKKIVLVHGEFDEQENLKREIEKRWDESQVLIPKLEDLIILD